VHPSDRKRTPRRGPPSRALPSHCAPSASLFPKPRR
jgi:hypothetical protein